MRCLRSRRLQATEWSLLLSAILKDRCSIKQIQFPDHTGAAVG
jgi:hypothetical protein